jgi:hypothetical protein
MSEAVKLEETPVGAEPITGPETSAAAPEVPTTEAPTIEAAPEATPAAEPTTESTEAKPEESAKGEKKEEAKEEKPEPKEITEGTLSKTHSGLLSYICLCSPSHE